MGLGSGIIPYWEIESPQPVLGLLSVSNSLCVPWFCLSVYIICTWPTSPFCLRQGGDEVLPAMAQEGCVKANCPVTAASRVSLALTDECPGPKQIFLCLFSVWVKHWFIPGSAMWCFLTDSDTQMQWAKLLRFLLLVMGDRFGFPPASK